MEYKVVDIEWERCNLLLTFDKETKEILLSNNKDKILLKVYNKKVLIPLTNINEQMLDKGLWHLEVKGKRVGVDSSLLKEFDNLTRIFYYRNELYAYNVSFKYFEKVFYINIHFMMENKKYKKYIRVFEGEKKKELIKNCFKLIGIKSLNIIYKLRRVFKNKHRKVILLLTENSNHLTENLQALVKPLNELPSKMLIYCHDDINDKRISTYYKTTIMLAKSDIILIENYTPILNILNLSKKTMIIQLWHAGVGFKAVGYARFGKQGSPHPFFSSHRKYTYAIVDNNNLKDIYKEVFGLNEDKIKAYGMPRLDNYFNKENIIKTIKEIYTEYPYLKEKKIILFAPTYRGATQDTAHYDINQLDFALLNNFCKKNNFLFIIKLHPFIKEKVQINSAYSDTIKDFSTYDINKLIYISDILITDYSSCVYEFSMFKRPIIYFRFDQEEYEYLRPYHGLDKASLDVVTDFKSLIEELEKYKDIDTKKKLNGLKKIKKEESIPKIIKLIEEGLDKL